MRSDTSGQVLSSQTATSNLSAATTTHAQDEGVSLNSLTPRRVNEVLDRIKQATEQLRQREGPEESRRAFAMLRGYLGAADRETAFAAVGEFLDSNADAPSGLEFSIGPDGFLAEASSLRVFLLDNLARVDRGGAAAHAEKILVSKDSPDEWAVALRNYALGRTDANARSFLREKWREMVLYETWQREPSIGFLQAFDVAVYLGGTELMPLLTDLVRRMERPAVAHAAFLSLDRLIIQAPADSLSQLLGNLDSLQGREATRASFFARADVSDPRQKKILEEYLLSPQIGGSELNAFAGLYPHASYMVSFNLLSQATTPDHAAIVHLDRESLRVVQEWLADPQFEQLAPHLQGIKSRLETFIQAAPKPP